MPVITGEMMAIPLSETAAKHGTYVTVGNAPKKLPAVNGATDRLELAIKSLEGTVDVLMAKLQPVMTVGPVGAGGGGGGGNCPATAPLADHIKDMAVRVEGVETALSSIIDLLEI